MKTPKEGRRIKTLDPYFAIIPYIMVERHDSQNTVQNYFLTEKADKLVRELRPKYPNIGLLHVFVAAYVRMVSQRPRVNRFIRGQKIYARNGIVFNMVIKRKMSIDEADTSIKVRFDGSETLIDVYQRMQDIINATMNVKENGMDSLARLLNYIPGLIKKFTIWMLKTLDYWGLLSRKITSVSPFHGSIFITNMASLNIPPIRHHLYNFGDVPVFIAFGKKRYEVIAQRKEQVEVVKVCDYIANLDERICDGFYFAGAMKILNDFLENPERLMEPPAEIVQDQK